MMLWTEQMLTQWLPIAGGVIWGGVVVFAIIKGLIDED